VMQALSSTHLAWRLKGLVFFFLNLRSKEE
jgi:hypothetical protein